MFVDLSLSPYTQNNKKKKKNNKKIERISSVSLSVSPLMV